MKKIFSFIIKNPIILILLIILIVYFPVGLTTQPEGLIRQQVSTIGIDVSEEGVEVSVLSYVSNQTDKYAKKYLLTSTTAPNIPFAITKIGSITGRIVSLTHTSVVVISEDIAKLGAQNYLDFFYRNENISDDTYLLCVKGKAKDLLFFEKERVNSTGFGLEEVSVFNAKHIYFTDNNLESFFKGYFSPINCSTIPIVEMTDNPQNEQLSSSGGGEQEESAEQKSQSSSSTKKRISKINKLGIFKNGKLEKELADELVFAYNLINPSTKNIYLGIENFSDNLFENAEIIFNIEFNKLKIKTFFENGKPVIHYSLYTGLTVDSIIANTLKKEYYKNNTNFLSEKLKNQIELKYKNKFKNLITELQIQQADILGIYSHFLDNNYLEFTNWFNNLENQKDFLNEIEYRLTVNPVLTN